MLRDKDTPGVDGYTVRTLIMESAKEHQEWAKFLPATDDIPTTHEHHVAHKQLADGRLAIEITVRRKSTEAAPVEQDELNKLDDGGLELEAAKAQMDIPAFRKLGSKAKKIKAIREKRETVILVGVRDPRATLAV